MTVNHMLVLVVGLAIATGIWVAVMTIFVWLMKRGERR